MVSLNLQLNLAFPMDALGIHPTEPHQNNEGLWQV